MEELIAVITVAAIILAVAFGYAFYRVNISKVGRSNYAEYLAGRRSRENI